MRYTPLFVQWKDKNYDRQIMKSSPNLFNLRWFVRGDINDVVQTVETVMFEWGGIIARCNGRQANEINKTRARVDTKKPTFVFFVIVNSRKLLIAYGVGQIRILKLSAVSDTAPYAPF